MNLANFFIQFLLLFLVVLVFYFYGDGVYAALYGALISLANSWLFNFFIHKQAIKNNTVFKDSFKSAAKNSFLRMVVIAIMIVLGLSLLKLKPMPIIFVFVAGQIGFIIDQVIQKNGTK